MRAGSPSALPSAALAPLKHATDAEGEASPSETTTVPDTSRTPWNLSIIPRKNEVGDLEARKAGMTTNMSVWPGGVHLVKWLAEQHEEHGLFEPKGAERLNILELGSGTGWMGMTLAANNPEADVKMTEMDCAMPLLRERAAESGLANITVDLCDWQLDRDNYLNGHAPDRECYDFIVGSELVWNVNTAEFLPYAFKAHATPGHTRIFYGHQPQYSAKAHAKFLDVCNELGLKLIEIVRSSGPRGDTLACKNTPDNSDLSSRFPTAAADADGESQADSDDCAENFALLFADEKDIFANVLTFTLYEVLVPMEETP